MQNAQRTEVRHHVRTERYPQDPARPSVSYSLHITGMSVLRLLRKPLLLTGKAPLQRTTRNTSLCLIVLAPCVSSHDASKQKQMRKNTLLQGMQSALCRTLYLDHRYEQSLRAPWSLDEMLQVPSQSQTWPALLKTSAGTSNLHSPSLPSTRARSRRQASSRYGPSQQHLQCLPARGSSWAALTKSPPGRTGPLER